MVFQLVRNTTAIWRNAARYCWFKMDLFVSKLYRKPARERSRDVRRHRRTAILLPQPSTASPAQTRTLRPRRATLPKQRGSGERQRAGRRGALPERTGGTVDSHQCASSELMASPPAAPLGARGQGRGRTRKSGQQAFGSAVGATPGVQLEREGHWSTHSLLVTPLPAPSQRAPPGACSSVGRL